MRRFELDLAGLDLQRLSIRIAGLLLGDEPMAGHLLQHVRLALLGHERDAVRGAGDVTTGRVVLRRRLHQAGDHGRFGNIKIARVLVEVTLRSSLHAVALVPVVDLVEVHLQDLVLG